MTELKKWLKKRNMTTNEFVALVGCSRQVIWKVTRNMAIDTKIAERIKTLTDGEICPVNHPVGKRHL